MWDSDNVIFNINGNGIEKLKKTLELAFGDNKIAGWKFKKEYGLCLYSYDSTSKKDINLFPTKITTSQCSEIVFDWLKSDEAKTVPCVGWDADSNHDGSNELGWRAYTDEWGHIDGDWYVLAIKPAYLWYGK